ncbi:MAG: hypothetical protein NC102_02675 [Clostridium sp.]|nr:hypothetical protein [Clostridium sp.]
MGNRGKKTYKAPDGTQFQVEEDGSLRKISNLPFEEESIPSKYQISESGEVYRVEADGSVTLIANIEDVSHASASAGSNTASSKKSHPGIWIAIISLLLIICALLYFIFGVKDHKLENKSPGGTVGIQNPGQPANGDISGEETKQLAETKYQPHFSEVREYRSGIDDSYYYDYVFYPDGTCGKFEGDGGWTGINIGTYEVVDGEINIILKGEPKFVINYDDSKLWYSGNTIPRVSPQLNSNEGQLFNDRTTFRGYDINGTDVYTLSFEDNRYQHSKFHPQENSHSPSTHITHYGSYWIKDKIIYLKNSDTEKKIYYFSSYGFFLDDIIYYQYVDVESDLQSIGSIEPMAQENETDQDMTSFQELKTFQTKISEDGAYLEASFYPDGICGIFYTIGFDAWSEIGKYQIDKDIIKADFPGGKSQSFRYNNGVCYMGDEIMDEVKVNNSIHYFEYTTVFSGYDPKSEYPEKNDKYYPNGKCILNEGNPSQESGTYYLKGGQIHITLNNGRELTYYCLSEQIYVVNRLEHRAHILPNE